MAKIEIDGNPVTASSLWYSKEIPPLLFESGGMIGMLGAVHSWHRVDAI
jgi:hypothetical protein